MVRRAKKEDIKDLNILGKEIISDFEKLYDMNNILDEEFSKVFVYVEEEKIVGFLHVTELYENIDIVNLVVDKNFRNKGFGTILMDYMITDANPRVRIITLEVNVNNEEALKLYKKFGFEVINKRKSYYNGEDAYLMSKQVGE